MSNRLSFFTSRVNYSLTLEKGDRWCKITGIVLDRDLTDYMVGMLTILLSCSWVMDSIFTKIVNNELPAFRLWENDVFMAILVPNPINPGHTLLIPKQQIDYIFDLPDDLYSSMWQIVKWMSPLIQKAMECKRIGIAVEGFGVPHVHIHLVPVNSGNELNPERAVSATSKQLSVVQNKICQAIDSSF